MHTECTFDEMYSQIFLSNALESKQDFSPGTFWSQYQSDIDLSLCRPHWCNPPRDTCECRYKRYNSIS